MAVTITVTSPTGSELALRDLLLGAQTDLDSPLAADANNYWLATTGTFLGGAVQLRFNSSGGDLTYAGSEPSAGTVDSLEVYSVSLGMVVATVTGFSHSAALVYSYIFVQHGLVAAFIFEDAHSFTGDSGDDKFVVDNANGNYGVGTLDGGDGDDYLQAGANGDTLNGGNDNDTLIGGNGYDVLNGGDGDDILRPGIGFNDLDGGTGFDIADYSDAVSAIVVDVAGQSVKSSDFSVSDSVKSIERFNGSKHADKFIGDASSTVFDGGAGKDEIIGGTGDNWAIGGADADTMDGGGGIDTLAYLGSAAGVTVTLGAPNAQTTATGGDAAGDKVKNFENIIGSDFKDSLTGNALANRLFGQIGDDTLKGMGGDDRLNGMAGKDTLDGGTENDLLDGGVDADNITGGAGVDTVTYEESASAVTVNLTANINTGGDAQGDKLFTVENIIGSDSDDTISGSIGDNVIEGGAGADKITGGGGKDFASYFGSSAGVQIDLALGSAAQTSTGDGSGDKLSGILNLRGSGFADKLTGDANDNLIEGGIDADELDGGLGTDTVSYESSAIGVELTLGTAGAQTTGSSGEAANDKVKNFENVIGSAFNDSLVGNEIANKFTGGKGNDFFEGYAGTDIIDGGEGVDTSSYENSDVAVTVNLTTNVNTGGHAQGDKLANIEDLYGSEYKDKFTGNTLANNINGGSDDDNIDGGAGNDVLSGGQGIDTITGNSGDDKIDGSTEGDILDGGTNIDTLSYLGSGAVKVKLGEGSAAQIQSAATKVTVNGVADIALGGSNAEGDSVKNFENLIGSELDDVLVGNSGINRIEGRAGKDNIDGLKGNDTIFGDAGDDKISGGDGDDVIEGGAGADKLDGGLGKNTLSYAGDTMGVAIDLNVLTSADGDAAGDTIVFSSFQNVRGGSGGDVIVGTAGVNMLEGGGNEDLLRGFGGKDVLDGGDAFDVADFLGATTGVTATLGVNGALTTVTAAAAAGSAAGTTIKNVEGLTGSGFNDKLAGNALDNSVIGGEGDDLIMGDSGQDNLFGDNGIDTLSYAISKAGVTVKINGTNGTSGQGGDAHTDNVFGFENIVGSGFDDILTSIAAAQGNNIKGGKGNDVIDGGEAGDMLFGEAGTDTLSYQNDSKGVTIVLKGAAAADVSGSVAAGNHAAGDVATGFENLLGGGNVDKLTGDTGANVIDGGAAGDDILDGAGGSDTVSYASLTAGGVTVTLGTNGAMTTGNGAFAENDSIKNFENIFGSNSGDDTLTGNNLVNNLFGGLGNDVLIGGGGADKLDGGAGVNAFVVGLDLVDYSMLTAAQAITVKLGANGVAAKVSSAAGSPAAGDVLINIEDVKGGAGNDRITGNEFVNELYGSDGDDVLEGGANQDFLLGGNGNDTASYAGAKSGVQFNLASNSGNKGDAQGDALNSIENFIGSAFADTFTGNAMVNKIEGGAGDDYIDGGDGADILDGGAGGSAIDVVNQQYADLLDYSALTDINLSITLGNGSVKTIVSATGVNASFANGEEIANFESIFAGGGDDKLSGNSVGNAIYGYGGNDWIDGGAGNDFMDGGGGTNTLSYETATAGITVSLFTSASQNTGGSGIDRINNFANLIGSSKNDKLTGHNGKNEITGGDGDDILEGGFGADIVSGGNGVDTASYENAGSHVTVDLNLQNGIAMQSGGSDEAGDILTGFENLTGGAHFDDLKGDGGANVIKGLDGGDIIEGGGGADTLDGGGGTDWLSYQSDTNAVTVTLGVNGAQTTATGLSHGGGDKVSNFENVRGGSGNDLLTGNNLGNDIEGGDGDDIIDGGLGDDFLDGEGGVNTVSYASITTGGVTVNLGLVTQNTGSGGIDELQNFVNITGSVKNDTLSGDGNNNVIAGGAGDDMINGHAGNDTLEGGLGNDTLNGGANFDTASYATATAAVTVDLSIATQQNTGGAGKDTLAAIEWLTGSKFNDILTGDGNSNTIIGGDGNDKIDGGATGDILTGGIGNDTFIYTSGAANGDDITDFTGGSDKIQVSKAGFGIPATVALNGAGANNFAAEYFVSGSSAVADKAHGQFVFDTDTFQLFWDADGTGGGGVSLIADFTNNHNLLATDFTLV